VLHTPGNDKKHYEANKLDLSNHRVHHFHIRFNSIGHWKKQRNTGCFCIHRHKVAMDIFPRCCLWNGLYIEHRNEIGNTASKVNIVSFNSDRALCQRSNLPNHNF